MDEIIKSLKVPPKEYRPLPFWSWNDRLNPEQLKWQIREMERAGLGGYFMHARAGLQTEYLSDEWMECIKACIEEGKKLGMQAWCYDEEGWPSGFAGGRVTALGDKYHVRWLEIELLEVNDYIKDENNILGIYMLNENNSFTYLNDGVDNIISNLSVGREETIIIVRQKSNPYYIDILNKEVVKAFIDSTYEKYFDRFRDEFGLGMPGFFTDEPQFSNGKVPWSYILQEAFFKRYGYDVINFLPALFMDFRGYEKIRYDFWAIVNELYVTSFGEQIYNWCAEHNCRFTGHVMSEDSLMSQMSATAGAMPFYEYMYMPGMDWLGRSISSPVIPKQVGSAAAQLGKKFVLSETFALCGWDVSFEELKWIAEWQYVNGVNLICQHLESYTIRGLRKRDYPPSLFYQQPWWDEYKVFNDYFAKLGAILASGKSGAEVLLLHPIKSAWIAYNHSNNKALQKLDRDFVKATETLSALHLEHHYGDETIIRKYGKVEEDRFIVGECSYKTLIMPSMLSIDVHTLELINQFLDNGGKVISMGDFPGLLNGVANNKSEQLKKRVTCIGDNKELLMSVIAKLDMQLIGISYNNTEVDCIHYHSRSVNGGKIFFLANLNQVESFDTKIIIRGKGRIRILSLESGEMEELFYIQKQNFTETELKFLPMQSHVLLFDEDVSGGVCKEVKEVKDLILNNRWSMESMDLNALTLDYCRYSIDDGEWSEETPVIKLMDILLNMKRNCKIALKFNFEVDMNLDNNKEFFGVIELADEFEIAVNGNEVKYTDQGYWKDSSFRKVDIKDYIKNGVNEIVIKRDFFQSQRVYDILFGENVLETELNKLTFDTELESIYLVGDFGVISKTPFTHGEKKAVFTDGGFVIVDKPSELETGDLTEQGFCFFAGAVKLSQNIVSTKGTNERLVLSFEKPNTAVTKVYINDILLKTLTWGPYSIDITDSIKEGLNKITVELISGNRNLLGPHHHIGGELHFVGTTSFSDKPGWADGAYGNNIWRDRYCFVKFGL